MGSDADQVLDRPYRREGGEHNGSGQAGQLRRVDPARHGRRNR